MTHNFTHHRTTTLFAEMNTLKGSVIGSCMPKHRYQRWLKFLKLIDQHLPVGKDLDLIVDHYATRKIANVRSWLAKHPRLHMDFTPTVLLGLIWLNASFVTYHKTAYDAIFFASVSSMIAVIDNYLAKENHDPKPLILTGKGSKYSHQGESRTGCIEYVPSFMTDTAMSGSEIGQRG